MDFATIFKEDLEYISRCILDYPDIETGGDFFGFWNNLGCPVIQYVTGPGRNSYHHVTFFKQDVEFLLDAGNAAYHSFGMQHIGSWHSHHKLGLAVPSSHDCRTMANAINRNGLSCFFMILGNVTYDNCTTVNGFLFDKQNQCRYAETQWHILYRTNPFKDSIDKVLSKKNIYHPQTRKARLVNLKIVNPERSSVFVLDFEPEKWLGSKKGREELRFVYEWIVQDYPEAKMFVNEITKDLTIAASDFKIIFPGNFPDTYPVFVRGETEVKQDTAFVYEDREEIVSYLSEFLNNVLVARKDEIADMGLDDRQYSPDDKKSDEDKQSDEDRQEIGNSDSEPIIDFNNIQNI